MDYLFLNNNFIIKKMKNLRYIFHLLFIILIKNSFQIETIKFTVVEFDNRYCESDKANYYFYIAGNFSAEPSHNDKIYIKLLYPKTTVECLAYSKNQYRKDKIRCDVNICEFPVKDNILISPEVPTSPNNKYEFPNWNSFMNQNPGVSNKINDTKIPCNPDINAYFIPDDIISLGCNGNKNEIKISGDWEAQKKPTFKETKFNMPIIINQEEKKAECSFTDLKNIKCLFQGYGKIHFNTFQFKAISTGYEVEGLNKAINVTECNNNENISNKITISIIILSLYLFLL